MFYLRILVSGGSLAPSTSVMLPTPTTINIIQSNTLDSMGVQTRHILFISPVISNRPDKIIYTDEQIDEFSQISSEFLNGSISMEEAILKLRGGGKFKDISFIVLYIWLWRLQNNHLQSFQPIQPPHPCRSSNPRSSLGLGGI